jgi:hypothetical protein
MKAVTVIFFCSWKFAAMFPVAIIVMRMSFWEALVYTNIGGILGAFVFCYFSGFLLRTWDKYWPEKLTVRRKKRKVFTRRNRKFVNIKVRYGLMGIVFLSPVILSIPLGAFLTVKYYGLKVMNVIWLVAGQVFWSLVYVIFYTQAANFAGG